MRALIGHFLSDEKVEHMASASAAKEILESIYNVFQGHLLLNILRARCVFSTLEVRAEERMPLYINPVQHPESVLRSMSADSDSNEMAITILNGLPRQYGNIITAVDALRHKKALLSLVNVKSRLSTRRPGTRQETICGEHEIGGFEQ